MAPVIVVLGPTGAGKSDQAKRLAAAKGWTRVSSGELLRGSGRPELIEAVKQGALAPTDIIWELVTTKLRTIKADEGLVLDGFPRLLNEAQRLDALLAEGGRKIDRVIEVFVPPAVAQQRLDHRGRADDSAEAVARKRRWYDTETAQVLKHYQPVFMQIDGSGTPDEVFELLEATL
ncbi:MAG TPA: nucleoside monophosphate kinase [Candidatus Saccharimonadales bacterium]|nr:nucleoside monophosphate kinase [Candidatus Saccharimonadales bacterium]